MAEKNGKKKSALEELNEQFMKMQASEAMEEEQEASESKHYPPGDRQRSKRLGLWIGAAVLAVVIVCLIWLLLIKPFGKAALTRDLGGYEDVLSSDEKKLWKEKKKEKDEFFVEVNTEIVANQKTAEAALRLINPPYSSYDIQVEIYLSGQKDKIVYQSDRIAPGTVVETVKLKETLKKDTYPVTICYTFYDEKKSVGLHVVAAELLVQDKK